MEEAPKLEEINQKLRIQNSELAERVQYWRVEYNKLETEKLELIKQNHDLTSDMIKYRELFLKYKSIENSVKLNLSRSLDDIVKTSEHIRKTFELYKDIENESQGTNISQSPKHTTFQNNVNHVHPMIRGVTIKKPVIRIPMLNSAMLNSMQAVPPVEENSPSPVIESDTDETPSQEATASLSPQVELLDLCVSLRRVDSLTPSRRVNRRVPGTTPLCDIRPINTSQSDVRQDVTANRSLFLEQNQENVIYNQNNVFVNEQAASSNFSADGSFQYRSRLECIIEDTENESINWVTSRQKPNPFVVLTRSLDDENNSALNRSPTNVSPATLDEDPLEGPSWRLDSHFVNVNVRRKNFISPAKKKKLDQLEEAEKDSEDTQIPDSTTSVTARDIAPELDISNQTFPSTMEFQSTPVGKSDNNASSEKKTMEKTEDQQNNMEIKVVLSKMEKKTSQRESTHKKRQKSKRVTNDSNETTFQTTSNTRSSTLMFQSSSEGVNVENSTIRPRRGESKNYKEKPLNKKLRRN